MKILIVGNDPKEIGGVANYTRPLSLKLVEMGHTVHYLEEYRKRYDLRNDILVTDVREVRCAYEIYDRNHSHSRRTLMEYRNRHGVRSIGRYGNWEYSGMEEALSQGK